MVAATKAPRSLGQNFRRSRQRRPRAASEHLLVVAHTRPARRHLREREQGAGAHTRPACRLFWITISCLYVAETKAPRGHGRAIQKVVAATKPLRRRGPDSRFVTETKAPYGLDGSRRKSRIGVAGTRPHARASCRCRIASRGNEGPAQPRQHLLIVAHTDRSR